MNTTTNEHANALQLRQTIHEMLLGVAPERAEELQRYWDEFSPQFNVMEDDGPDGPVVLDAGGYVNIRFNHRIMRLFWLSSFALWEGYSAYYHYVEAEQTDLTRFMEIVDCFEATRIAVYVDAVPWPAGLPQPGELVDHELGNPARVGGELAIFGVSWAVLHELQHLIHQQHGTAAAWDDVDACRREELSCDAFATNILMERIREYPVDSAHDAAVVLAKRQTGICCALFAMTLLARGNWGPGARHPAVQERIDHVLGLMDAQQLSKAAGIIAISAFTTLKMAYAGAPNPEAAIGAVAVREDWSPADDLF
ncbi:MAG: phage exclusion protein Lit family protein [Cypionkella sp.]